MTFLNLHFDKLLLASFVIFFWSFHLNQPADMALGGLLLLIQGKKNNEQ